MKISRHDLIKKLVAEQHISTQEELCELLQQHGQKVTQATVSRDIKKLLLAKAPDGKGGYYYVCPQEAVMDGVAAKSPKKVSAVSILDVKANDYLVVVHTQPGAANILGFTLDNAKWPEVLGTIAGDDTVFIALRSPKDRATVVKRLQEMGG